MTKGGLLKRDWFVALIVALLFVVAAVNHASPLDRLEYLAYDTAVRLTPRNPAATEQIVIVAVDEASLARLGAWPWPRTLLAELITQLARARPKAIGLMQPLDAAQIDPGLEYINKIDAVLDDTRLARRAPREAKQIARVVHEARQTLNTDQRLAEAIIAAGNVYLPMRMRRAASPDAPPPLLPAFVKRQRVDAGPDAAGGQVSAGVEMVYPLAEFGEHAAGIGHIDVVVDTDGAVRSAPLMLRYDGGYYPSLALLLAARQLNVSPRGLDTVPGEGVRLGALIVPTGPAMQVHAAFHARANGAPAITSYSFHEVHAGKIARQAFRNKIVLIGATAADIGARHVTPVAPAMSDPELTANLVANLVDQEFYRRPAWVPAAEGGLYALVALYLMFVLPAMPGALAALASLLLLSALLAGGQYLLVNDQLWVRSVSPALLLVTGHLLLLARRRLIAGRRRAQSDSASAQTSRLLGLAFQQQGQLDMAMDKFRSLPVDGSVLELIYNLALDFERKRQHHKAAAAYDYILQHDRRFKDVAERRRRAQQADGGLLIGAKGAAAGGAVMLDAVDHKPTIGRYELERELGKGAMGAVYLGRDPTINRVVAIKTMALSAEFEGTDLDQARERFFREAETAGRLNHPSIVTIYDAGEDHELAYIAMEYLDGKDLTNYINPDKLLPVHEVMEILGKTADALAYAHSQEVVHRDIKPANIMYDERSRAIKITDFGIARITAASRTKTGVVLGTPSYMSPEQLAGKRVDGRSDLFSLGVMAFELLTGRQPFQGDNMAALTYQIANEKHPRITQLRPELAPCVGGIIDKLLHKDASKRYQNGTELSKAIGRCMDNAINKKAVAR